MEIENACQGQSVRRSEDQQLFTLMGSALGYMIRRLQQQQKESRAISEGVQSLLRESIVRNYNKYQNKGYCPIYAKESMRHVYEAYHKLGGNDVATRLYTTLLAMPEENEEASPANEKQGTVPEQLQAHFPFIL